MPVVNIQKSLKYHIKPVPKTYTGYKAILIEKLNALLGNDGTPLFAGVYGVEETEPDGYPCAFVLERVGKGQIIDTHRNEREWQFSVVIHQEIGRRTPEEAYTVMLDAVDRVIKSMDEDPMLLDANGQSQCKWVRVVPLDFEYSQRESAVHRALLVVAIVDLVNRYAP
jgi:hypothetical protein